MNKKEMEALATQISIEMKKEFKKKVKEEIWNSVRYDLQQIISKEISQFFQDHLKADIQEYLIENKESLLKAMCIASNDIGTLLGECIIEKFKDNTKDTWGRSKVLKALFE